MTPARFATLTRRYASLRLAIAGDFCLDRYLEIDPGLAETSIETGLPVHNVVRVRAQPGAAGTILNNLCALGVGHLHPLGFCGTDGEGHELRDALQQQPGVHLDHFVVTSARCTFTYCKPLLVRPGSPPVELNRLDSKNWTPTPPEVEARLAAALQALAPQIHGLILLDQVDRPQTGVVTQQLLTTVAHLAPNYPNLLMIADSRRGLRGFPPVTFKMNATELAALTETPPDAPLSRLQPAALAVAQQNQRPVFVTLAERGMLGALPNGAIHHVPAVPVRGEIDIVGAGDAVTANLTAALAADATVPEAMELAQAAASVVIHQLGTTGTASVEQLRKVLFSG